MKKILVVSMLFIAVLFSSCGGVKQWTTYPAMAIDQNKQYSAVIKTNYGDITVQLFTKEAPLAVNNFVFLSRQGFYKGVKFHRIIEDFMIQSGDPFGTGFGSPGYKFADDEPITRDYIAGTLAMANSGADTNGSQFFITLADLNSPSSKYRLTKNYVIFGIVTANFDVVQKIGSVPTTLGSDGAQSKPTVDVHIDTIIIKEQ